MFDFCRSRPRWPPDDDDGWCEAECNGDKNFEQVKKAACAIAKR